jgi:ubiquinone/menaquinone biosynthesis C-methylase UbiE
MTPRRPLPMAPSKWFGRLMETLNTPDYEAALAAISVPRAGALLEIGFGSGRFLAMLIKARPDVRVAGADPTPAMVALARENPTLQVANADLRESGAEALPWDDGAFDAVVAINSFQFWAAPDRAAAEIARVLKPHGRICLVLRSHRGGAPDWLPNPMSKSDDEPGAAIAWLRANGFERAERVGDRPIIVCARR